MLVDIPSEIGRGQSLLTCAIDPHLLPHRVPGDDADDDEDGDDHGVPGDREDGSDGDDVYTCS